MAPRQSPTAAGTPARPLVDRTVNRTLAGQYAAAAEEVERIIEATYRVIESTGTVEPRMRDILSEAGLSTQAFYRHFRSKDELMLVLLDDGRRRHADYLAHRMSKAAPGVGRIEAWIAGTLAQAKDARAAARTRPFIVNLGRLQEQYPEDHAESVAVLVSLLELAIRDGVAVGELVSVDPHRDAMAIYHLSVGVMEHHLRARTTPTNADVDHVIAFALRGLDVPV
jgi:AcrR family transcriptional regulator